MNKLSFSDINNVVNNYAANNASTRMGHNIVCVVSLKERSIYAAGRHLLSHVAKAIMVNHCTFPKYDSKVAAVTGMPITPTELKGMTWVNYPYIKKANKSGFRYLNIYYGVGDVRMETRTKWLWNGREATPAEVVTIKNYLKASVGNGEVKAAMYQIDEVNDWDGFYYFGESKEEARKIWDEIGK